MKNRAVHSKFIMTDDRWMSIGSANANSRSFELDTELNLSIGEPDVVAAFRRRLWSHNLGVTESVVSGWRVSDFLARWDAIAAGQLGAYAAKYGRRGSDSIRLHGNSGAKAQRYSR
jgi:phosphatidylserine/phosphatidylglycerophosphate/cardiolipin synthase-like enzyme